MSRLNVISLRGGCLGLLLGGFAAWTMPSPAAATCLNPRDRFFYLDEELVHPGETIYIYINAPDSEGDPPCPQDVRRSGFSIIDFENVVQSIIASINDSSAVAPRLVYNGRVCHETNYSCGDANLSDYADDFESITGRPPGVTIQVRECGTNVGGIAAARSCPRVDFHPLTASEMRVPDAVTRFPAAVAYGGDHLAVAWLEQLDTSEVSDVHFAVRMKAPARSRRRVRGASPNLECIRRGHWRPRRVNKSGRRWDSARSPTRM